MNAVTGGTGLVGAHLLYKLAAKGEQIKALKRKNSSTDFVKKVFSWYSDNPEQLFSKIQWIEGNLLDIFSLENLIQDTNILYHTAAVVSFEKKDRELLLKTNIEGTANLINVLLDHKETKLCYVSSTGALGRSSDKEKPITEKTHFSSSVNPSVYSVSKYESEREVWRGIEEGLNAVIVNPSIILGPGNWNKGSAKLFETVYNGLFFYTAGSNGFVYVNDLTEIMILLAESNISGQQFIVNAENISYENLFKWIATALKVKPPNKKAGKILSELSWRVLELRRIITGKTSSITRETTNTAQQTYYYNNQKLLKYIDFQYTPIIKAIEQTAEIFLKEKAG